MLDLFGEVPISIEKGKERFGSEEVDLLYLEIVSEGELINDMTENLLRLKRVIERGDESICSVRKDAWIDLMWVFGLDEPSPVPFDLACAVTNSDAESIRQMILKEFSKEIHFMILKIKQRSPFIANQIQNGLQKKGYKI